MTVYKDFLKKNRLKQVELADYLGIKEPSISNVVRGKGNLSEENLAKILNNDRGWDVSMFTRGGNVNSVVNSSNFKYANGDGVSAQDLLDVVKENQRQMGLLIESISVLTNKLK